MTLKLGIPSKGRLMDQTADWLAARGIEVTRAGAAREYAATVTGAPGVELVLTAAGEIPRELGAGRLHLGVTGIDMVREKLGLWETRVEEVARLGFGRADLVLAVPDFWRDVTTLDDLDAAATAFRAAHGHRLRIATKYHRLVRDFLRGHEVSDYQLVDSQGATEGVVKTLGAEVIADITTTGATLKDNHLRVLEDGLVLQSEATLYRSTVADWSAADAVWAGLKAKLAG